MSSLQDKLKEIDIEFLHGVPVHLPDSAIQQITDAFIADGWLPPENGGKVWEVGQSLMTGEEWHKKFEQELEDNYDPKNPVYNSLSRAEALHIAKRASGVKR